MTTPRTEIVNRHLAAYAQAKRLKNAGAMVGAVDALMELFSLAKVDPAESDELTVVIRRFIAERGPDGELIRRPVKRGPVIEHTAEPTPIADISDAEAERLAALFAAHGHEPSDVDDAAEFLRSLLSEAPETADAE